MRHMTRLLAALAGETRLRLIRLLLHEELCVCELVDALRIRQYKVSRHLRTLRAVGLVQARRNGRWMYYSIGRRVLLQGFHQDLLKVIDIHLARLPQVGKDDARLSRRLATRRNGRCVSGKTCC